MPSENCMPKCVRVAYTSDGIWKCKACGRQKYCTFSPEYMEQLRAQDDDKGKGKDKGKDKGKYKGKGKEKG